jgi:hypothetical protein
MMNKKTIFALATTLVVGLGSTAIAGEGSPDLALPNYGAHGNDPDGSNYPSTGSTFRDPWQGQYSTAPRLRERDTNTGRVIRQDRYEEQNGIND